MLLHQSLCAAGALHSTCPAPWQAEGMKHFRLTLTPLSTAGVQIVRVKAFGFLQLVQYCPDLLDLQQKAKCYYENGKNSCAIFSQDSFPLYTEELT